jgi:hypothetical protein
MMWCLHLQGLYYMRYLLYEVIEYYNDAFDVLNELSGNIHSLLI